MTISIVNKPYSYTDSVNFDTDKSNISPFHIRPLPLKKTNKPIRSLTLETNELINSVNFFKPKNQNERIKLVKMHANISKLSAKLEKSNLHDPRLVEVNKKLAAVEWILTHIKPTKIESPLPETRKAASDSTPLKLVDMNDLIDRAAGWISDQDPTNKKRLLDATPNELLKSKNCDGSTKQITINHLLESYQLIKTSKWFKEPDVNIQLSLLRLEQVMQFYVDNLQKTDPQYQSLENALKDISSNRIKDFVGKICAIEITKLEEFQNGLSTDKLPSLKYKMLLDMLGFTAVSFEFRNQIAAGKDKQERLNIANELGTQKLGKGIGLEEISGATSAEVEKNSEEAAYAFLKGYQYIKDAGKLPQLCEKLSTPCMSGKLLSVMKFADELMLGVPEESTVSKEKTFFMPRVAISQSIEECIVDDDTQGDEAAFISGLNHTIFKGNTAYQADLARRLENLSVSETAESFIQFLKDHTIWENGDWEKITAKLIEHEEFSTMFAQGKAQALLMT